MHSRQSYELEVNNSSVSHVEMNFQNQESKPSARNFDSASNNSMRLRDGDREPEIRDDAGMGYPGNIEEESQYEIGDNRNRTSYMVSNQDGRPQSSIMHNP